MLDQCEPSSSCPEGQQDSCLNILDIISNDAGPRLATVRGGVGYSMRIPGSQTFRANAHVVEVLLSPVTDLEYNTGSSDWKAAHAPAGVVLPSPANANSFARWSSPKESAVIALKPSALTELATYELDSAEFRWPLPGTVDPFALRIAQTLKAELTERERANAPYADALITEFCVHLLRKYATDKTPGRVKSQLSNHHARRVQAYMRENLARKITLSELAAVCGVSSSHFVNSFTTTFGEPPYRYLINLRLAYAERLLTERDIPIAEVAYLTGFSSQSHLTWAMRKFRRVTPSKLRRGK